SGAGASRSCAASPPARPADERACALCRGRLRRGGAGAGRARRLDPARPARPPARARRARGGRHPPPLRRGEGGIVSSGIGESAAGPACRRWLVRLPFLLFMALAGVFLSQLLSGRAASVVPSALIGAEAPVTPLPPLEESGLPGLEPSQFA